MAGLTLASPSAERRGFSPWRETWRRYRRHKLALVSAVLLLVLVLAVVFGPFVWRVPINEIDFTAHLEGPSLAHPFGTDDLGQDILARMIYGGRISLAVGLAAMTVSVIVGTLIGALAGMSRGALGHALMWLTDLFLSLPQLPLLLLLIYLFRDGLKAVFGPEGGIFILIVLVIGGLRWMPVARLVRAQFLSLREKEFVEAARALGASQMRQVVRHILPNALGPVIIAGTIDVAAAIIAEFDAVLSRPRLSAGYPDLGAAAVRRQGLSRHCRALGAVSGRRHLPRGHGHQFHRRRLARRARRAAGDLMAPLLEIKGLKTHFATDDGIVQAVDGVDISINRGETLCVVGESGCGKTVTAMSILQLIAMPPGRIVEGEIIFEGRDLVPLTSHQLDEVRAKEIGFIFQEPMTSLNPVLTVGEQIAESLRVHERLPQKQAFARTIEMLKLVQIPNAEARVNDYPHQFSGGMRQRVMIAMALACQPKLVIADEPTTALDVTIQAQILDLLQDMKERFGMAVMLITHAMGVVAETAQRVVVMYAGKVVEEADVDSLFADPRHPYTQGLIRSIPRIDLDSEHKSRLETIGGSVPILIDPPPGCRFAPRCRHVMNVCREREPVLREIAAGHRMACHLGEAP